MLLPWGRFSWSNLQLAYHPRRGGGGHLSWPSPGPRTCQRTTEAFSWLAKRSKVKQKGKTGKETDKLDSFSFSRF